MDNLTHSLVGLFLARAGLNRAAPDVTPILILAANLPDVDVVSALAGGAPACLYWHRGFTHSVAFSPIAAILAVLIVRCFTRKRGSWPASILAAWLGVLSHLLLDLTNDYGVRVLAPFSGAWLHWDITSVIDLWIWAGLLLAALAPLLARLVSSEIGVRRKAYPARGWAIAGLVFLVVWDAGRGVLHQRALAILDARLYQSQKPVQTAAFPTALRPWEWDGLVETPDRAFLYELELGRYFDPGLGKSFHRSDPGAAVQALRSQPGFGVLIDFAQYPLWRVNDDENNSRYTLTDLRFGDPVEQTFTCSARLIGRTSGADEHCNFTFQPNFAP